MSNQHKIFLTTLCASSFLFLMGCPLDKVKVTVNKAKSSSYTLPNVDLSDPNSITASTSDGELGKIAIANSGATFPSTGFTTGLAITGPDIATTDVTEAGGFRGLNADDMSEEYQIFGTVISGKETTSYAAQNVRPRLAGKPIGANTITVFGEVDYAYTYGDTDTGDITSNSAKGIVYVKGDTFSATFEDIELGGKVSGKNIVGGTSKLTIPGKTATGSLEGVLTSSTDKSGTATTPIIATGLDAAGVFHGSDGDTLSYAGAFQK